MYLFLCFIFWDISNHFISFFYCSSTVVFIFLPPLSPARLTPTSHPQSFPPWLSTWVLYTCSLMILPLLSPVITLLPLLWFLSVFSLFQWDMELVLPMHNMHPYFSLKNLGKKVHIRCGKIRYIASSMGTEMLFHPPLGFSQHTRHCLAHSNYSTRLYWVDKCASLSSTLTPL